MSKKPYLVITSISSGQNKILQSFGTYCKKNEIPFILIGDSKTPKDFALDGCSFYGMEEQKNLLYSFAHLVPENHYSRKNIGYLIAADKGAELIIETDDDNYAMPEFWHERERVHESYVIENASWINLYRYFTNERIWPRGFALEHLNDPPVAIENFPVLKVYCPVQQGLANEDPDVDALFRLTHKLPLNFNPGPNVAIGADSWCPFNSQNTTWFREAFLLTYLPSYCSIRMTDIWRSFVVQRICSANGWHILFHKPTVWQERNDHNLIKDFEDEIPGYLNNKNICNILAGLDILKGAEKIGDNLLKCYKSLVEMNLIGTEEIPLLEAWINDMDNILGRYNIN